ncbi:hypothetical protein COOONC_27675 [Cooperia oncophora]
MEVVGGKEAINVDLRRTKHILFTPRDSYMITYEPYITYGQKSSPTQKPEPNMRVFSVADGKQVAALVALKEGYLANGGHQICDMGYGSDAHEGAFHCGLA